jgi:hypothetical protein
MRANWSAIGLVVAATAIFLGVFFAVSLARSPELGDAADQPTDQPHASSDRTFSGRSVLGRRGSDGGDRADGTENSGTSEEDTSRDDAPPDGEAPDALPEVSPLDDPLVESTLRRWRPPGETTRQPLFDGRAVRVLWIAAHESPSTGDQLDQEIVAMILGEDAGAVAVYRSSDGSPSAVREYLVVTETESLTYLAYIEGEAVVDTEWIVSDEVP